MHLDMSVASITTMSSQAMLVTKQKQKSRSRFSCKILKMTKIWDIICII